MLQSAKNTFIYEYKGYDGDQRRIEYAISIPFKENCNELAYEIMIQIDPIMQFLNINTELASQLKKFVHDENQKFYDSRDENLIEQVKTQEIDTDTLIKDLEKLYKEEILEFAEREGPSDEDIFAQSFHRLVHSSSLPEILIKEQAYAKTILEMVQRMDSETQLLNQMQQQEMESQIQQLDITVTTDDINNLLAYQYSTHSQMRKGWESGMQAKQGHQKNEYREWITNQVSQTFMDSPVATPIGNRSSMFVSQTPSMEESFTIHLGSQQKHMHNIRILSADIRDMCSPLHGNENISGLNMALGLYSSSLCGVIVLTPSGSVQANNDIVKHANMSTEFHFNQIDRQLAKIEQDLINLNDGEKNARLSTKLRAGDCFITRHSNLAQSHIIFHLISDESFSSPSEINSRHPVIMGLRNILKTASKHDVTMLTIPALLRHEMSEDMTVSWCMRRAELVFKCAKGFMIESATWGGAELNTLQLLLPYDISEELFTTLAGMVPHVFRVANPKILKDS